MGFANRTETRFPSQGIASRGFFAALCIQFSTTAR